MKVKNNSNFSLLHHFTYSLLALFLSLISCHATEEQKIMNNPNDVIILINDVSSLKTQTATIKSTQIELKRSIEESNKRITTLEKFMNAGSEKTMMVVESPKIGKTIPNNIAVKIAFGGAVLGTALYLYDSSLDSVFLPFYFTTSTYQTIKHFLPKETILAASIAGGVLATYLYYSYPTFASPFIFLYYTITIYSVFSNIGYYGSAASSIPI